MPLGQVIIDYLATVPAAPPSVVAYQHDLAIGAALIERGLGRPATITDVEIDTLARLFITYESEHGRAAAARAWSSWNRLVNTMVGQGLLPAGSPMGGVPRPRRDQHPPVTLTQVQVDALLSALASGRPGGRKPWPIRDHALILLELSSGLRLAEVVNTDLDHLGGQPGTRTIKVVSPGPVPDRLLGIPADTEVILEAYLIDRWHRFPHPGPLPASPWQAPPGTPLWLGDDGTRLTRSKMAAIVNRSLRTIGIDRTLASTNTLRLTCAANMLSLGADAAAVAAHLGYASMASLDPLLPNVDQSAPHPNPSTNVRFLTDAILPGETR